MKKLLCPIVTVASIFLNPVLLNAEAQATYEEIVAKRAQIVGDPIEINTNYFIGWTGAWDTVIMNKTKNWEHWLPSGSSVSWKRNLQGPPVITDLLANKQQIAYLGDNPAIVSTTKRAIAPINIVAVNLTSPGRMCGHIILGKGAPDFAGYKEALAWLDGKTVGVPRGSCADRLGQVMLKAEGIDVTWQQMQSEVIVTSLQAGKIDAAAVYEPHSSKAVFDGYAKYAISSALYDELDSNVILMREDFISANREVAKAWLKANIEALFFVYERRVDVIDLVKIELPGYTKENLWQAIYGNLPKDTGANQYILTGQMSFTDEVKDMLQRAYRFLYDINIVVDPEFSPEAIQEDLITEAFEELELDPTKPLFEITDGDFGQNPFKGDELTQE